MTSDKCNQTSCQFHPDNDLIPKGMNKNLLISMCPVCAECGEKPHIINSDCQTCLTCENVPDQLRDKTKLKGIGIKQSIKVGQSEAEENVTA